MEDFSTLTVKVLKDECKNRGLAVGGLKKELVERLENYQANGTSPPRRPRGRPRKMSSTTGVGVASASASSSTTSFSHLSNGSVARMAGNGHAPGSSGSSSQTSITDSASTSGCRLRHHSVSKAQLEEERAERQGIVLWRRPITTVQYFLAEMGVLLKDWAVELINHKLIVVFVLLVSGLLTLLYHAEGGHQEHVEFLRTKVLWCLYWVGLGVLSSVGLGTGLHTFVLYLGPHIAAVTLAAYECGGLNFPEPPYPDEIECPTQTSVVSLWTIMSKVRLEAMMWGLGTAIGELPPYFMARTARLSGKHDEDDEVDEELEELEELEKHAAEPHSIMERAKLYVHELVKKVGFGGILLCASIPNPLFDLAGITCGHFLIPFWTFFGATVIGKAIIKTHIQKLFVIFVFSEHHVENAVRLMKDIPYVGKKVYQPFKDWLSSQKDKWHHKDDVVKHAPKENLLSWIFEKVLVAMLLYFVVSIVNSLAQKYHRRVCKANHEALGGAEKKQE